MIHAPSHGGLEFRCPGCHVGPGALVTSSRDSTLHRWSLPWRWKTILFPTWDGTKPYIYIYRNTFRGEINDSVIPSISIWCPRCCRKSSEFFHPPAQRQPSNDGPPSATNASPGALGSPAPGALGSPRARAVRVFQTPTAVERAPAQSSAHRAFSGKGFPNMLSALKERPNEAKRFYALYPPVLLGLDQISHIALIRPIRV